MAFDIEKIASLAKIRLKDDEKKKLQKDLDTILNYIEKLKELDTNDIEPTSHVLNLENVFREDVVKPSNVIDDVLNHAPKRDGKFFKVPKVVDKES